MTTDEQDPGSEPTTPHEEPVQSSAPDDSALAGMFRALRIFLVPFLLSWALAYVGSARGAEWLYFVGLGGVTLSLVVLMIWLIS